MLESLKKKSHGVTIRTQSFITSATKNYFPHLLLFIKVSLKPDCWILLYTCKFKVIKSRPFLIFFWYKDRKNSNMWLMVSSRFSNLISPSLKVPILLILCLVDIIAWTNLEFLSPSLSHRTLDLCFHFIASSSLSWQIALLIEISTHLFRRCMARFFFDVKVLYFFKDACLS